MNRYSSLMKRVKDGECILIDGATGTEVERKGVPQHKNAWNGGAALSHPEIVRQVHQDYINLGAEIVIVTLFQRISMLYLMPIKAITLKF
jgi:S-methylmethionine-dependent homocysteine/selenocysteine methylase